MNRFKVISILVMSFLAIMLPVSSLLAQPGFPSPPDQGPVATIWLVLASGALGSYLIRKYRK